MSDSYDGGDSYDGNETGSETTTDTGDEVSAFSDSTESDVPETGDNGEPDDLTGDSESAFAATDTGETEVTSTSTSDTKEGDAASPFGSTESKDGKTDSKDGTTDTKDGKTDTKDGKTDTKDGKTDESKQETDYSRPTHWRAGMRDEVWENAKDEHGRVRDPVTGKYMSKDSPWDMGHKPGYEFHKHQASARERGISREEFLNEYYNVEHYRPELPSSNRSHKGESNTDDYFGD